MFYRHDWRGGIDHNCAAKLPSAIFTGYTWKHRCELVRRSGVCGAGRPRRGLEESGIEEASRSSQRWVKLRWWYVWECKRFIFNNRFDQKKLLVSFTCQPTSGQVRPPKSVFIQQCFPDCGANALAFPLHSHETVSISFSSYYDPSCLTRLTIHVCVFI